MSEKVATTVPLDWNEVWFTNCPMVSANNVDQELGWCREEFKKLGVEYAYFRHAPENNWYPHYVHNLDNLVRFGGLYPPIHVHADLRRTVLLGATWVYEGGVMQVRARDKIFRVKDLKGNAMAAPFSWLFITAKVDQSITFGALADRAYGTAPFTVSATASSGLAVTFSSTTARVCTAGRRTTCGRFRGFHCPPGVGIFDLSPTSQD